MANIFNRLYQGLQKTRQVIGTGIGNIILGKKAIDADLLEEIETQLILADVGVQTTQDIIQYLTQTIKRKQLSDPKILIDNLKEHLMHLLKPYTQPLTLDKKPFVILMVGVNGSGKTTTTAKLAVSFQRMGKKVLLAAGDTFRAAAVEQLKEWGTRYNIPVVAQSTGADSASVIYDALQAAQARNYDIVLADTAGRLHNKDALMEELKKIKKVLKKLDPQAPHETMLLLDASTGQNALQQAQVFHEAIQLTSITISKLDGTAKGGIVFSIANQLKLPIRYISVGEQIDDFKPLVAEDFVKALFEDV